MSTSAVRASRFGANHLLAPPAADVVAHLVAIHPERQHALRTDGRLDFLVVHQRRRAAELAVLADPIGAKTITARQLWHCTLRVAACQPRSSSGSSRSAVTNPARRPCRSRDRWRPGDSVPQNGHTSFCLPGSHSALRAARRTVVLLEGGDLRVTRFSRVAGVRGVLAVLDGSRGSRGSRSSRRITAFSRPPIRPLES